MPAQHDRTGMQVCSWHCLLRHLLPASSLRLADTWCCVYEPVPSSKYQASKSRKTGYIRTLYLSTSITEHHMRVGGAHVKLCIAYDTMQQGLVHMYAMQMARTVKAHVKVNIWLTSRCMCAWHAPCTQSNMPSLHLCRSCHAKHK